MFLKLHFGILELRLSFLRLCLCILELYLRCSCKNGFQNASLVSLYCTRFRTLINDAFWKPFLQLHCNYSKASANTPEYQSEASETFLGKECDLHLTKEDSQFVAKQHNNTVLIMFSIRTI